MIEDMSLTNLLVLNKKRERDFLDTGVVFKEIGIRLRMWCALRHYTRIFWSLVQAISIY